MDEKTIGLRIREFRTSRNLTLGEVADTSRITGGTLSKIERAEISPPLSTLLRISEALGITLADLVAEPRSNYPKFVVTRNGEGVQIEDANQTHTKHALTISMPYMGAEPFYHTRQPSFPTLNSLLENAEFPDYYMHSHRGQEFTYVLSGKLVVIIDGELVVLAKGDSICHDTTYRHCYFVVGKHPARYLSVHIGGHNLPRRTESSGE